MYYRRIKELREDRDIKQREIGTALSITQKCYANYENGHRGIPTEILCQLADYHHTSVDYLLGRTDKKEPYPPAKR